MKKTYKTKHIGGMAFEMMLDGHHRLIMDAAENVGGHDKGPRPKQLLISALTGCTGMDVVSILGKMRVSYDDFELIVETKSAEDHPKVYTEIHLIYQFTGKDLEENKEKLLKAIDLSQDKYCGASAMLKQAVEITYELKLIEN